ncbi:pentapeptide repeat-containing protein (plasmid) [Pseudoalteromonas espejiana]
MLTFIKAVKSVQNRFIFSMKKMGILLTGFKLLERQQLANIDLKYASLEYSDLNNASLNNANLESANCKKRIYKKAELRGANLTKGKPKSERTW